MRGVCLRLNADYRHPARELKGVVPDDAARDASDRLLGFGAVRPWATAAERPAHGLSGSIRPAGGAELTAGAGEGRIRGESAAYCSPAYAPAGGR